MADPQIGITVPSVLIEDLVRAAIVRELGDQEALIEGIVKAALGAKDPNGYRNETLFMKQTQEMIRKVATQAMQEWIDSNREKIKAAFVKHLSSRDGAAIKKLVEGMVDGVSRYSVSVNFNFKEE